MPFAERAAALRALETARKSRVLAYVLSDRETFPPGVPGFTAMLANEPQLLLVDLLREIEHVEKLDLFLYTRGGATECVWPLVMVLRQHCDFLTVIVPFRAHSAGTMIGLGADEIIMTNYAELSPIDPTTGNQFNPRDPTNPGNQFGISVEDVVAYFKLSEEIAKITDEGHRLEVFKQLAGNVHPLALGNVQRVYLLIRRLAQRLLALHMDEAKDEKRITEIIEGLTTQFYSHVHAIVRPEAQALLGDWVKEPSAAELPLIEAVFDLYVQDLHLTEKYNVPAVIGQAGSITETAVGAFLETAACSYIHEVEMVISQRANLPQGMPIGIPPGAGGQLQLPPGVPRAYDFAVQRLGWTSNGQGK